MIEAPAPVAPAPYAALSVVPDGDGYVLGSTYTRDFVAVPRIGGEVVRWLQSGLTVDECAARAGQEMGEPVDVAGFLAGLTAAGLLPASPETAAPARPRQIPRWRRRAGRLLFGPVGLAVQSAVAVAGLTAMVAVPSLRPRYTDIIVSRVPLLSMLLGVVLGVVSGLTHEFAHVLGAAGRDVPSRISISRRMVTLVYQTDLTRLWSVPRRARVVPLLAGIVVDAAIAGAGVLLELGGFTVPVLRALVFVNLSAILFQLQVYMRTDLYALFVVATGCRNLWATKGAVARRLIGRATAEDTALLGTVGRREIAWAHVYLVLYVPGVLWTAWFFTVFGVPAIARLAHMSYAAAAHGLFTPLGAAGAAALAVTAASTGFILLGLVRTAVRLARQLVRRTGTVPGRHRRAATTAGRHRRSFDARAAAPQG